MNGLAERLKPPEVVSFPGSHLGLRWRPLIPSDLGAVADLIREVEKEDDAIFRTSSQEIADLALGHLTASPLEVIVGIAQDHGIVALGSVKVLTGVTEAAVAIVNAVIHPLWRGRGVGRSLLHWQDGRARQMLVEYFGAESTLQASIANWVDGHMTDRRRLYIAAGFYAKHMFQVMYRDLEGSEHLAPIPENTKICPMSEVSFSQLHRVHSEVFSDHPLTEARDFWWNRALEDYEDRWSFVALSDEGQICGYCMAGRSAESWIAHGRLEAYINTIGVPADHRGKGIASALISASARAAAHDGMNRIGIDADLKSPTHAQSVYEHLGFVNDRTRVFYSIDQ
jgi:acetyltransferase, GNAT family protein